MNSSPPPLPLPPNKANNKKIRLRQAKEWLLEHPTEKPATAARIFKINERTLNNSIRRGPTNQHHGGQNRILDPSQEAAIHHFIQSYLQHSQLPTREIVFKAICCIRRAKDPLAPIPSTRWYTQWWQRSGLHKIKTKPIARIRITAQDLVEVERWFDEYIEVLDKYDIQRKDLYNFDETGFTVGCPRGVEILVPLDVREIYSLSPENRRSLTIVETISADGREPIPPVIIIQGKHHMESWYRGKLSSNELVLLSENGFTTNELAIRYLQHFIQCSKAGPNQPYKLLLMDNHGSHRTPEFILLARQNNVIPFSYIPHLTHCMQPLDVGVFQPYKHWHNKAIQYAIENLDFEYSISSFLRDLPSIRSNTFTKPTIKKAFLEAGMWRPNIKAVKEKMRKYAKLESKEEALPELVLEPRTPTNTHQVIKKMGSLEPKIRPLLSSPSRQAYDSLSRGTSNTLYKGETWKIERDMLYTRVSEFTKKAPTSRKRLQKGGELTGQYAQQMIQQKDQLEASKAQRADTRVRRIAANKARKELHSNGIIARRTERLRKQALTSLLPRDLGASHLYIPIPDPKSKARLVEESQLSGLQLDSQLAIEEIVTRNQPSNRVAWLNDDFVQFTGVDIDMDKDSTSESDEFEEEDN